MITAQVNTPFEAVVTNALPDRVGDISVMIYDPTDGREVMGAMTDSIVEPQPGTYSTQLIIMEAGDFQIRWELDGVPAEEGVKVLDSYIPVPSDGIYPTVDDIGALLRARTQDADDDEIGTFDETTRPTQAEVERLIRQAASVVLNSTGDVTDLPCATADTIREQVNTNIGWLTVCLIELSYFPEQARSDRSAFQFYYNMLTDEMTGMPSLIRAVMECRGGEVEPDDGGSKRPSWAFPEDQGGLVGWQTRW
jgi:hypothetical protein